MKHACVFLADGFEEIEGLTVVDILHRACFSRILDHGRTPAPL